MMDQFLASNPIEKATLLREHVVHATRIFNRRVQTFIKQIVMSNYEGSLPVMFYTYRVEMQLRGMAHIHGCLWLKSDFLHRCSQLTEYQYVEELRQFHNMLSTN